MMDLGDSEACRLRGNHDILQILQRVAVAVQQRVPPPSQGKEKRRKRKGEENEKKTKTTTTKKKKNRRKTKKKKDRIQWMLNYVMKMGFLSFFLLFFPFFLVRNRQAD
jgi:hypothetical protein